MIDYDSDQLNSDKIETEEVGFLHRGQNNKIIFSKSKEGSNSENLLEITKDQNHYILKLNEYKIDEYENIVSPNSTWFLLRKTFMDERMNEYNIKEGDILKIGRITIRIRTIKFKKNNGNKNTLPNTLNEISDKNLQIIHMENKKLDSDHHHGKACRICYIEEETTENPLLQPCTCSGSMKYIHLECLRQWLSNRVFKHIENNEKCNIYLFKQPECELCKTKFPDIIKHNGNTYVILDFNHKFENYIIVESLTLDKKQNKYIYIVNMDNAKNIITIGRGSESSIFINDISVSRLHCFFNINKKAKKLFLVDNNSKFGTLILIQAKEITLGLDLKLHVQIGRSYLVFVSKISSNFFECCGVKEKNNSDYYYLQNKDKIIFNKTLIIRSDNINQELDKPKVEETKINNNEIDSNNKTSVNGSNKDEIEINENEIKESNNDENNQ